MTVNVTEISFIRNWSTLKGETRESCLITPKSSRDLCKSTCLNNDWINKLEIFWYDKTKLRSSGLKAFSSVPSLYKKLTFANRLALEVMKK